MRNASYLLFYFPICWVVLMVMEACRSDDPKRILRKTIENFGLLTLVLAVGSALIYVINRYL